MSAAALPVVRIRGLTRRFTKKGVLEGIDLDITKGEFVALLGRSGSGKSTLLRAMAALDHEAIGDGLLEVPGRVSVVFQDARLLPWKRVFDNIVLGLAGPGVRERGQRVLDDVGLGTRGQSWPYELSGGEQQRVSLARSLVSNPELLLADEPFGALDALTRLRMHALLKRLSALYQPAVLLVTHDVDEAIELASRVVVLDAGHIAADVPVDLPAAGTQRLAEAARIRRLLLGHLGVQAADADESAEAAGAPG